MTDELERFFHDYADRYMAGDAGAIADMCETPFLAVRSGSPIHLSDRAAALGHFAGAIAAYQAAGAAAADISDIEVHPQGTEAAMATVHWTVRAADGSVLRDFRTSYQLVAADPWRILSYVNHDTVPRD